MINHQLFLKKLGNYILDFAEEITQLQYFIKQLGVQVKLTPNWGGGLFLDFVKCMLSPKALSCKNSRECFKILVKDVTSQDVLVLE